MVSGVDWIHLTKNQNPFFSFCEEGISLQFPWNCCNQLSPDCHIQSSHIQCS